MLDDGYNLYIPELITELEKLFDDDLTIRLRFKS